MREYKRKFEAKEDDMFVTVREWLDECKNIGFFNSDGHGRWVKDGYINDHDEVFSSEPQDATHVIWYNK